MVFGKKTVIAQSVVISTIVMEIVNAGVAQQMNKQIEKARKITKNHIFLNVDTQRKLGKNYRVEYFIFGKRELTIGV
jgi:hypothetical protein